MNMLIFPAHVYSKIKHATVLCHLARCKQRVSDGLRWMGDLGGNLESNILHAVCVYTILCLRLYHLESVIEI